MNSAAKQAFVGLGANLGDREKTLQAAVDRLRQTTGIDWVEASSIYETDPVGRTDQPLFLNAVAGLQTVLSPEALLAALLAIEREFGRVRVERWGPRILDLDLLLFEGEVRNSEFLMLPHPRFKERDFVIVPLRQLLAVPRFQRSCWKLLRGSLDLSPPAAGVRLFGRISEGTP